MHGKNGHGAFGFSIGYCMRQKRVYYDIVFASVPKGEHAEYIFKVGLVSVKTALLTFKRQKGKKHENTVVC